MLYSAGMVPALKSGILATVAGAGSDAFATANQKGCSCKHLSLPAMPAARSINTGLTAMMVTKSMRMT
jgi:hypothetical protein